MKSYKRKLAIGIATLLVLMGMIGLEASQEKNTLQHSLPQESDETLDINSGGTNDETYVYLNEDQRRPEAINPEVEPLTMQEEVNDAGYNTDTGNTILKALPVYPGEPIDGFPGRARAGSIEVGGRDSEDWYYFSVCTGQQIQFSMTPESNFDLELYDTEANVVASSATGGTETINYNADATGNWFIRIYPGDGAEAAAYTFEVSIDGQNDAGSGRDAGNTIGAAMSLSPGSYSGYLDSTDEEDWYSFTANAGQGIFVTVEPSAKSDVDIHLYNPSGEKVHYASYYGVDELEYPADASGTWSIQLDMFPGWDTSKWPDNYHLYGSGAYDLTLSIGGSADAPPAPIPQPEITPIAQTFVVNDNPNSVQDEYGYLAAVPAANYFDSGMRYVSPIVYQGVDAMPTWFTTVDQTTQYLLDDWNTYLARHGVTAEEYVVPSNPVTAAADIATMKWSTSSTAVVAVDGSDFVDEIETVVDESSSLTSSPQIERLTPESTRFKDVGGNLAVPMFLGKKWGAIHLVATGDMFNGDTGIITPRYEPVMEDWWPYPSDFRGPDTDTFYPVTIPGFWAPYVTSSSGLEEFQIIKYAGDRYTIPVDTTDCSLKVTIETDDPSNLIVYLIDPYGNIRRPNVPHWNGGEIKPIHIWYGGHWFNDYDEYRVWIVEKHADYTVEVHHPMTGKWTAIVVPYLDHETGDIGFSGGYHITAQLRRHNPDRIAAALSAANGAVIASANHAPLLYIKKDSVPSETSNALSTLEATNVIFVNINGVSSASVSGATEYTTMQEVVDVIKENSHSENFITITSMATGDGYFAPAAMAAAYHVSPVLNIGEAACAYNTLDMIAAWREYAGDYYHGCRSVGHLPMMDEPFDLREALQEFLQEQEVPPIGFDLKLRWFGGVHDDIYGNLTAKYGLDLAGQEAYLFVSPRDTDIRDVICRVLIGNNSYAGHIPVETPAFSSAIVVREILYPAIIYANPGRSVTTSQLTNYPDGGSWTGNDGISYANYATREVKQSFSSRGRFYEGHSIWDNVLERYNTGVSISFYSGHGTGGSGIACQYRNIAEQFPYAEPRHERLFDFDWPDSWRGTSGYDDKQTKTARWGGSSYYNAAEPNLYDVIHFKWADQAFENLHSELEIWHSCTTGSHFGPIVYLAHGSALWYGNCGSGSSIQNDLHISWMFYDVMVKGESIGKAKSDYLWIHNRDFTTRDPTTLYGPSSMHGGGLSNVGAIYGDPTMTCYAPDWIEPEPVTL